MVAKTLWNYGKRVELSEQCGTSTLVIHHECVTSIWLLVELALPKGSFFNYTMRKSLLNKCHLVSISKNVVFYVFLVVRIY